MKNGSMIAAFFMAATFLTAPLQAQKLTKIEQDAQRKGVTLPQSPWHLMDIWWYFQHSTKNFQRLDIDIHIDKDVPDDVNLYISPLGLAQLNGIRCYGGLQTHIGGWTDKNSRKIVRSGKGGIFSRWSKNNQPIGLDYVDLLPGGYCESNGYEGEFCSVRRPYEWKAGNYTFSLIKEETIDFKNAPHTWFSLNIRSHRDQSEWKIGRLLFEGRDFEFWNCHAAFIEIYGGKSDIPEVTVTFGYPRINGAEPAYRNAVARRETQGLAAAPNCADVQTEADKVKVSISPVIREKEFLQSNLKLNKLMPLRDMR